MAEKMTFEQVMENISMLAQSQYFYGRLKRNIESLDEDTLAEVKEQLNDKFTDVVDMVLFFES